MSKVLFTIEYSSRPVNRLQRVPWRGGTHRDAKRDIRHLRREGKRELRNLD